MPDSLALDAQALGLLAQLLAAEPAVRESELAALRLADLGLAQRVSRLLAAADDPLVSRAVLAPLLRGLADATAPTWRAGDRVAGWRLLNPLGEGGTARVWLAERADGGLKRTVAIKLPWATSLEGASADRWARERDVLAALDHPHIAHLFDAGVTESGQPYIVMEHVQGLPITAHAQAHALGLRERVALFAQVLTAVDHAHRHLVVHRDLKPGNILVTTQGQAKLLDFGIAKLLAPPPSAAALTQDAALLTPRYAAPEQVLGQPVTTATDVYAAGVVLYELLTGRSPYAGAEGLSALQMMQAVTDATPCAPGLGADLDTVLLKALAKSPAERYPSIQRLADDLTLWAEQRPILARRVPHWRRAWLLLRRHRRLAAVSAGSLATLALAGGVAWQQWQASAASDERAATVQRFLIATLGDIEPPEGFESATPALRAQLDSALARANNDYAAQPLVLGEVLSEIGRLYARLDLAEPALRTLRRSALLLQGGGASSHEALQRTQVLLAGEVGNHDMPEGARLARQAHDACASTTPRCGLVRSLAHTELARMASEAGHDGDALAHARQAVAQARQAVGDGAAETLLAVEVLAVLARNQGLIQEAAQTLAQAVATAEPLRLRALQRASLRRTQATLALDLGRVEEAHQRVSALLQVPTSGYERVLQWRLLTSVEWQRGRLDAAGAAAQQSLTAAQTTGDRFGLRLAAQWQARVDAAQGAYTAHTAHTARAPDVAAGSRTTTANSPNSPAARLQEIDTQLAADGLPASGFDRLRLKRWLAEAQLHAGRGHQALDTLETALEMHANSPAAQTLEWAEALDFAGSVASQQHRWAQALDWHAQAQSRWAATLPAGHPALLRNAVHQAVARAQAGPLSAQGLAAAEAWQAIQPAGSVWAIQWQPAPAGHPGGVAPGAAPLFQSG